MLLGRIKCRKEKWQGSEDKPQASQQIGSGRRQRVSRRGRVGTARKIEEGPTEYKAESLSRIETYVVPEV